MLSVRKIWEGIRKEGLNYGLPMLFVRMGTGPSFQPEDLVREVYTTTKCKWVCFLGEETTKIGMGTLVKGLSSLNLSTEIEVGGDVRDPGWIHTVDRWVIDYVENGSFNYGALRSQDMIRFQIGGEGDLSFVSEKLEELRMFPGTKLLKVEDSTGSLESLLTQVLLLVRGVDRCRIYW
jgi:hypothetical protein